MKEKEAIQILIRHTTRDLRGSGTGIRSIPCGKEREEAIQAIERVWQKAYGFPFRESDRCKLHI